MAINTFTSTNFQQICDELTAADSVLGLMLKRDGYPPMWTRPASFPSLVWIILEQQVSLASAKAAYDKLAERLGEITPAAVSALSDEELRACYFSRQKTSYVRGLAHAITTGHISIESFLMKPDDQVRAELKSLKGVGDWTADVFLMFSLQRTDLFPLGDIALVNSMRHEWQLDKSTPKATLELLADKWRPWRSIAAMMLWHAYLERRKKKLK